MAKFTLIILCAMFTMSYSLNTKIFAKTLSELNPKSENYQQFVKAIFEKKINESCWFIAKNGSCVPDLETTLSKTVATTLSTTLSTRRVIREVTTTPKPINLAKIAIMAGIKLLAPLKTKLVEKMYKSADTVNQTALQQFIMGTVTSNSVILSKIGNKIKTNVTIQKGTTILTTIMFLCSMIGTVIWFVKWCKDYAHKQANNRQIMLEAYYQQRREHEERRQLAINEV